MCFIILLLLGLFLAHRSAGPPQRVSPLQMANARLLACWACDLLVKLNFRDSGSYSVCHIMASVKGCLWTCLVTCFLKWQTDLEFVTAVFWVWKFLHTFKTYNFWIWFNMIWFMCNVFKLSVSIIFLITEKVSKSNNHKDNNMVGINRWVTSTFSS